MVSSLLNLRQRVRRPPEDSVQLRKLEFGAQAAGILALAYAGRLWLPAVLALAILAAGSFYAYRARVRHRNSVRLAVFVSLHLAGLYMVVGLFAGFRLPQAQFAMLALAIVSFEFFSRLNLYSGMGLGLINLYVAATLSRDVVFGVFLLAYLGFLLAFLWRAETEDGLRDNPRVLRLPKSSGVGVRLRSPGHGPAMWARFGMGALAAATLVFLVTPHFAGRPLIMPVALNAPIPSGPASEIINPAVPLLQIGGWSDGTSDYYYGFDSRLDLSYRGGLSDSIVMYVRSVAWSHWRSHSYDYYDGRTWSQSNGGELRVLGRAPGQPFFIPSDQQALGEQFVQSFYIVRPLPNLVFVAYRPVQAFFPANQMVVDNGDGLRVGGPLQAGTVYSIVSQRPEYDADKLRAAGTNYPSHITARYLQLPDNISGRVRALAAQVVAEARADTPYDMAEALRVHLQTNYPYDYYPPPLPPGAEVCDQFLFVDGRGVCEQYVTSLVVMLRVMKIPARLVAGYGSGTYNPITGYYEVRASDAHAWAEVYFPGYGWVPFDPTPGWEGNPGVGPVRRWVFSSLLDNVNLSTISLGAVTEVGKAAFVALGGPLLIVLGIAGVGLLGWGLANLIRERRAGRVRHLRGLTDSPTRREILRAYRRAMRRLQRAGWTPRAPAQTPLEHAALLGTPELVELAEAVNVAAYRPQPPEESMVARVRAISQRLRIGGSQEYQ